MEKNELIKQMNETKFIKYGNFTLKSGINSNYYVDIKSLFSNPKIIKELCELIYIKLSFILNKNNIKKENIAICGLPYAGIPFASFISIKYNIPLILLRKEIKAYGTKKIYEGSLSNKTNLFLIDDIFTTGTSIKESLSKFNQTNPDISIKTITIIDRSSDIKIQDKTKLDYESIFLLEEFTQKLN